MKQQTVKKNIPALRFPGFIGEWEEKKLGNMFSMSAGGDIPKLNVSFVKDKKFKYPIYANAERDKGLYGYADIYKINKEVVTVAGRGVNIGIAHARSEKFYPIVRLLILDPKEKLSTIFFEYAINNLHIKVESTGVPQLTVPDLSSYKVSFPLIDEQQKIASFLSSVDERLQQLQQQQSLLEQYKKGCMQQLFNQKLRFKDSKGKAYPDWERKHLHEVLIEHKVRNAESVYQEVFSVAKNQGVINQIEHLGRSYSSADISNYKVVFPDDIVSRPKIG